MITQNRMKIFLVFFSGLKSDIHLFILCAAPSLEVFKLSWLGLAAAWDSGKGWKWMERIFYRILCYFCICTVLVSLILLSTKNRVKTAQTVSLYHGRKKLYFEATAQNMHSSCNLLDNLWYTDHEIGSLIIVFSSIKRTKLIWEWDKEYDTLEVNLKKNKIKAHLSLHQIQ